MPESSNRAGWIVGGIVLLGCLGVCGGGALLVGIWGVAGFSALEPDPPLDELEETPEWLLATAEELEVCGAEESNALGPDAIPPEEQIRMYAQLSAYVFVLHATDGTHIEMSYEGEAYPYTELERNLGERRLLEPSRDQLYVVNEPPVSNAAAERVLADAIRLGYREALRCRAAAPTDAIMAGSTDLAPPDQPPFAAGDPAGGGRDGTGSSDDRALGGPGGRRPRVPRIRTGNPDVRGALSREVIRRVIRRHINEVRFCYEQELSPHPDLEGQVTVTFIISPTGNVQTAAISRSTLENVRVESCVTQAVRRWEFPEPDGGGVVGVNCPFTFTSSP